MAKDLFIDLLYVEKVTDDKRTDNQFKELLNGFKMITTCRFDITRHHELGLEVYMYSCVYIIYRHGSLRKVIFHALPI